MSNANFDKNGSGGVVSAPGFDLTVGLGSTGFLKLLLNGGALQLVGSNPAEGTAATSLATSGTIDTTIGWQRVITAGAVTSIALEAGVRHGQVCFITNDKDSGGTITFHATTATSRLAVASMVIVVGGGAIVIWDATDAIWCPVAKV